LKVGFLLVTGLGDFGFFIVALGGKLSKFYPYVVGDFDRQ
jgi:hypothetical protein